MKKRIIALLMAVVCLLALVGCECEHEWSAPDCVNPERCSKCGEYGAAPLGHSWIDPNCVDPAICSVCGKTDAEPLGHKEGQWVETLDITALTITKEQPCLRCGEVLATETEQLTSLVDGSLYMFTPEEYIVIINDIYAELNLDLQAELVVEENGRLNGLVTRGGERFAELTFTAYDGVMTESRAKERSVGQLTITFAHADLKDGAAAVVELPPEEEVMDAVQPVIMACMADFAQEDAEELVSFFYENMVNQPTGNIKSFDYEQDGMTYFITDELLYTVFGILPTVAWSVDVN